MYAGTTQPANPVGYVRTLTPLEEDHHVYRATWEDFVILVPLSGGLGLLGGMLLVIILWHWKKRRYWLMLGMPLIAAFFVIWLILLDDVYRFIRPWALQRVLLEVVIQAVFIGVGILIGRPVARWLVRLCVPPRPRQHLAFLWKIDGKMPPGIPQSQ